MFNESAFVGKKEFELTYLLTNQPTNQLHRVESFLRNYEFLNY